MSSHRLSAALWTGSEHADTIRTCMGSLVFREVGGKQKTRRCHDRADCHLNRPKSPMARRGKTPVLHLAVETALFPSARPAGEASPKWPSQTQAHTTQVCLYFATVPAAVAGRTCLVTVGSQALTLKMSIGDFQPPGWAIPATPSLFKNQFNFWAPRPLPAASPPGA